MREVVTLQLGNLANHTATHFWNAQESYFTYGDSKPSVVDHNIHWRAGVGHDGSDTFLPRTVIYDLSSNFGALPKINPLYDAAPSIDPCRDSLWFGLPHIQRQPSVEISTYQEDLNYGTKSSLLDATAVRYWSDFSRSYFHPKSLVQLDGVEVDEGPRPLDSFTFGSQLFSSLDRKFELFDRDFRPFAEECDSMQGIQIFTTVNDAWGGFASAYVEALRDEYPKSCIWVWGLQESPADFARDRRRLRSANVAQSVRGLCSLATMLVPLALPEKKLPSYINYRHDSPWYLSAIFSTAAETATLQPRIAASSQQQCSLGSLAENLNLCGRQTLASIGMDVGRHDNGFNEMPALNMFQLSCQADGESRESNRRLFGQSSVYRGFTYAGDSPANTGPLFVGDSVVRQDCSLPFPLLDSYPPVYKNAFTGHAAIPVRTVMSTSSSIATSIMNLQTQVLLSQNSLEEREALRNDLFELADAYTVDWSESSEDGNA